MESNSMSEKLSEAAALAAKFINQTNRHVFLTGKAGTGKTTFLKHIIQHTYKKAIIVAPTGIAAINAGGSTIHSVFQLPFGAFVPVNVYQQQGGSLIQLNDRNSLFRNHTMNKTKRALIREIELLIIDEVSMLRADLLDAIDSMMRHVRNRSHLSFGGAQVLFIGDMLQLPPVIKEEEWTVLKQFYKSIYFFDALALQNNQPAYIELDKIYRQNNAEFIELLNNLRDNKVTKNDEALLNSYYKPGFKQRLEDKYITLTTHNYKANAINREFLELINDTEFKYDAIIKDEFPENLFPIEKTIDLKVGAQIMFVKNDISGEQRFYNGKLARIHALKANEITVEFEDGKKFKLERYTWENKRYILNPTTNEIEEEVVGEFIQFPIKLAWAITVHKSQGLTFDKAIIDVADAFAPGQVYVALSRLRDLSGLVLSSPINFGSLLKDEVIFQFASARESKEDLVNKLNTDTSRFLRYYLNDAFNFNWLNDSLNRHYKEHFEISKSSFKERFNEWMHDIKSKTEQLRNNAEKFTRQINLIIDNAEPEWISTLRKRVSDACIYFEPILKSIGNSVFLQIETLKEQKKIKQYIQELLKLEVLYYEQIKKINKALGLCDSLISGKEYDYSSVEKLIHDRERENKIKQAENHKVIKREKGDTQKETLRLYKEGKTLDEIVSERKLSLNTIEGHLVSFVRSGDVNAHDFVTAEKCIKIIDKAKELNTRSLKSIREALGDDYSFSEIKFALETIEE